MREVFLQDSESGYVYMFDADTHEKLHIFPNLGRAVTHAYLNGWRVVDGYKHQDELDRQNRCIAFLLDSMPADAFARMCSAWAERCDRAGQWSPMTVEWAAEYMHGLHSTYGYIN